MSVPKIIHSLWIGPLPPPDKWMKTWRVKNPDWEYVYWDNKKVYSRTWQNQHLVDHYTNLAKQAMSFRSARGITFTGEKATLFAWHVIADILRYEILYEYGGYMPGADTACLKPLTGNVPWLSHDLYTVNTGHMHAHRQATLEQTDPLYTLQMKRYAPENASPILASSKKNPWLKTIITELGKKTELGEAVDTTGNVFMGEMLTKYPPENALIVPYLKNKDRANTYSQHFSGTTKGSYRRGRTQHLW